MVKPLIWFFDGSSSWYMHPHFSQPLYTYVTPFTPFKVNKNKILLSTTLNAVIYCCYLWIYYVFFEFTMYLWIYFIMLHIEKMWFLANQWRFFCCLQRRICNCTCIDTPVQFLWHTSHTFPCTALLCSI